MKTPAGNGGCFHFPALANTSWKLLGLVLFFIIKEILTWFWKINKIVSLLEEIEENTRLKNKRPLDSTSRGLLQLGFVLFAEDFLQSVVCLEDATSDALRDGEGG
ncbi:MAG: hypothetical protein P4M11_00570 [Candidatus Pacebacteria bacterium]|nr:hypothetical protein [Candidatus Paceibacterota bacterium]